MRMSSFLAEYRFGRHYRTPRDKRDFIKISSFAAVKSKQNCIPLFRRHLGHTLMTMRIANKYIVLLKIENAANIDFCRKKLLELVFSRQNAKASSAIFCRHLTASLLCKFHLFVGQV